MSWYLLIVFIHVMTSILWVGYLLFWTIIITPITRRFDREKADAVLRLVNAAEWPPAEIPLPARLRLFQVGWIFLAALVITGAVMAAFKGVTWSMIASGRFLADPFGAVLACKVVLVVVLFILQGRLAARPTRPLVFANTGVAIVLIGLSAYLARGGLG